MRLRNWSPFATVLLLTAAVFGSGAPHGLTPTFSAWNDSARAIATVTAGTWESPSNTCTAYGFNGEELDGCSLGSLQFNGWGDPGRQIRNYYATFSVPSGTRSVSFDLDLREAVGQSSSWEWEHAGVVSGAQFTSREGWTCEELPRVRGNGADWQVPVIYFQVAEDRGTSSTRCS